MTENPFTHIETRFDQLERRVEDLRVAITGRETGSGERDTGGVEVATEETGLSTHSIYRLVSQRKIPHSKRLGRLYFSRKALRSWIVDGKRDVVK